MLSLRPEPCDSGFTLGSGINVWSGIKVLVGIFGKKNKHTVLNNHVGKKICGIYQH